MVWSRTVKTIRTELLEIAYEEGGPKNGPLVLLLHGWPDAPRGWSAVAQRLHAEGWHTVAPYLAYQPRGLFKIPSFDQTRRFWYQWFLCVDGGLAKVQD